MCGQPVYLMIHEICYLCNSIINRRSNWLHKYQVIINEIASILFLKNLRHDEMTSVFDRG